MVAVFCVPLEGYGHTRRMGERRFNIGISINTTALSAVSVIRATPKRKLQPKPPEQTPGPQLPQRRLQLKHLKRQHLCGVSELDVRETRGAVCNISSKCSPGQFCWGVHQNFCVSIPKREYTNPLQSTVWSRCGESDIEARTFCGDLCTWQCATGSKLQECPFQLLR